MDSNASRYVALDVLEAETDSAGSTPPPLCSDLNHIELRFSDANAGKWTFGRDESCNVVLQGAGISRRHCHISIEEDGFYITDTSRYGTAVSYDGKFGTETSSKWLLAPLPGRLISWCSYAAAPSRRCRYVYSVAES